MQLKRTKIVCTIGPASWDKKILEALAKAGMNVARLNFSHTVTEQLINDIRHTAKIVHKPIAIMADLQGPKLRLGKFDGIRQISTNDTLKLSSEAENDQTPTQFDLSPYVKKGQRIFLNDGLVELIVEGIRAKTILTKAVNNGWISSNKGINIPDTNIGRASFTSKDQQDLLFATEHRVDYIALSFVQTADDILLVKNLLKQQNSTIRVIAKIEKKAAVDNLEDIIKVTDAIMVARGDLAIETSASEVPVVQQKIIKLARQYYKPVIIATQMLESMMENPRPTRAEVSDIANAVLDQVDAVMLSGETASGKYPVEAVSIMKEVILSVESHPDYRHNISVEWETRDPSNILFGAITSSAAQLTHRLNAKLIVVATATGRTARVLSSFRPNAPIYAITHDKQTANQLAMVWGVKSDVVYTTNSSDIFWKHILQAIKDSHFVKKSDQVVIITGSKIGVPGDTDSIKVETI